MSLCGGGSVSGLMDELYGEWIREGKLHGSIILELKSDDGEVYSIETVFKREDIDGPLKIEQKTIPDVPWDDVFVCGYGASRGIVGDKHLFEYVVTDSVYTLFKYGENLQNPELVLRRIKDTYKEGDSNVLEKKILNWFDRVLMLPDGSIKLGVGGLGVSGPWGDMPLLVLGDGHQATITWIMDMLGWALFYDYNMFQEEISGIVILDEIEQHLHPIWQRRIIPLLKNVFPTVQFIFTTHSPLVAGNTGRLSKDDPESKLFHLHREDKEVKISEIGERLEELNLDQILASEAFGHIFNVSKEIEDVLKDSSILAAKDNRTEDEEKRYNEFKERLKEVMFPKGRTLIERIVEKEYYEDLEKKIEDFKKILENKS